MSRTSVRLWIEQTEFPGHQVLELKASLFEMGSEIASESLLRWGGPTGADGLFEGRTELLSALSGVLRAALTPGSSHELRTWEGKTVKMVPRERFWSAPATDSQKSEAEGRNDKVSGLDLNALRRALDKLGIVQFQEPTGNLADARVGACSLTDEEHHALWTARHAEEVQPEPETEYVEIGFWHHNCVDGKVHDHNGAKADSAYHRLCEPVFRKVKR